MPDKWMTIAEAATALRVHPRTVERRIASGKIQTRRDGSGQLHLLIELPENGPAPVAALETVRELAADQVSLATGSASAIVKLAQDDAVRARAELSVARQEVDAARQSARNAWGAVTVMALAICIAVGWTAHKITRTDDEVRRLNNHAAAIEREAQQLLIDRDRARQQAQAALVQSAEALGRLDAYLEQSAKRPTTRPASLMDRLATAFWNE